MPGIEGGTNSQPRKMSDKDLAATLGIEVEPKPPEQTLVQPQEAIVENEVNHPIFEKVDAISATSERSLDKLVALTSLVKRNPDYFGGDPRLTEEFNKRVHAKIEDIRNGPALVEKKREFWKKWTTGSMVTAVGGTMLGIGAGVFTAKYGFDATYMKDILGQSVNVPMAAGFATALLSFGSAGISKFMEGLASYKQRTLENITYNRLGRS